MSRYWFFLIGLSCLSMLLVTSCDEDNDDNCESAPLFCTRDYPGEGTLKIKVTHNATHTHIPIAVLSGYFEGRDTLFLDTLTSPSREYSLPVDQRYTTAAYYSVGDKNIIAVDGGEVLVNQDEYDCGDDFCYSITDLTTNVELASYLR